FEAWEGVQRHGQDIADRLAQGFTGLLQAQPPQFPVAGGVAQADSLRDRPPRGPLRRLPRCPGREGVLPRRGRRLRHRHRREARPGWRGRLGRPSVAPCSTPCASCPCRSGTARSGAASCRRSLRRPRPRLRWVRRRWGSR
ncbi:hypothetical protein EE612_005498, partial [Oryza sativa]